MFDFSGRVLLLTGASGGIGRAVAELFLEAGAKLLLADLNELDVASLASSLDPVGDRTLAMGYDASRAEHAEAAVALCLDRFGRLDFLVPAAGVLNRVRAYARSGSIPSRPVVSHGQRSCGTRGFSATIASVFRCFLNTPVNAFTSGSERRTA